MSDLLYSFGMGLLCGAVVGGFGLQRIAHALAEIGTELKRKFKD